MTKRIHPEWKMVKQRKPHCPVCGEQLFGDNSAMMPYKCSCGVWQSSWDKPGYAIIQPEAYIKKLKGHAVDSSSSDGRQAE